jgi:hypothetical protein
VVVKCWPAACVSDVRCAPKGEVLITEVLITGISAKGERRLAEQEVLIVDLKRQHQDASSSQAELETMRENQRQRQQDRPRLLSLMQL